MKTVSVALLLVVALLVVPAQAERIKDITSVAGVRENQLIGYGLVVGLDGTGDKTSQTQFTAQSLKSMLAQLGVVIPPGVNPKPKNVAAVMISANLPPFAKPGQSIDITVSSLGNAKSLRGGTLLMAPLKGADGNVYAIAQGNLVVGGLGVEGSDGSKVTVNVPSVGRIPNGATVERAVPNPFARSNKLVLNLHTADFTTAHRVVKAINALIGEGTAKALDGASVEVRAPSDPSQKVGFLSILENVTLEPGEAPARVVINSRTGTIVIGAHVRVMPAAVAHGTLVVTISEETAVSQPAPFARVGSTEVVPQSNVQVTQEDARMFLFKPGVSLNDIVQAVNQVGAAPGDLVAILEALKEAGALRAELIVI
ncbi:MAG TPA: flagellar basal body P-ring protein FlgI [Chromatiaceae bacterium]|nr:flagellar basal body P-ring protein FlgI [Chromatiaceae bacterium]